MRPLDRSWVGVLAALFALVVLPGQALAGNATNINVTVPAAKVSISGKVAKHGDGAVSGAVVQLVKPGDTFPSAITIADASGSFAFTDLATGQYIVAINPQTSAPTYMPGFYRQANSPDHFTTIQSSATKLNYSGTKIGGVNVAVAVGHSISGKIKAAGDLSPLKGVAVVATFDSSTNPSPFFAFSGYTNASGTYVITGVPNGKFSVRADPNGNFLAPRVNFLGGCYKNAPSHYYTANCASATLITVNNANVGNKTFDLPYGYRITGAIKDAHGHNLCATVQATGSTFAIFPASTTACGRFSVVGLAPGDYTVTLTDAASSHFVSGSYATNANHFVQTGTTGAKVHITTADTDLGTIRPTAGHTISGAIKNAAGQGIANVTVALYGSTGSYDTATTSTNGKFTFFGVGNGTHTIQELPGTSGKNLRGGYFKSGASGNFTSDGNHATALSSANHSGIVIKPPPGFIISGKIQNAAHQGLSTAVSLQNTAFSFVFASTNAQGMYQAVGLDPGDYTLTVGSAKLGSTIYSGGYYTTANANHYTSAIGGATPIHVGP